jgi:hypothetical protein
MKQKYQRWTSEHFKEINTTNGYGRCKEVSEEMAKAFPELIVVRGYVQTLFGKRGHWWLKTEEGEIVDPTAKQFPGIFSYEEWKDGMEIRLGRCFNCGEEIWGQPEDRSYFCNDECAKSAAKYLEGMSM